MARILFIEDEADIMIGCVEVLKSRHAVTVKRTGADAFAELRERANEYDLVILDLMLSHGNAAKPQYEIPRMPAEEVGEYLFKECKFLGESLPVIILTAIRSNMNGMRKAPKVTILMKPVSTDALMQQIEAMLADSQKTGDGSKSDHASQPNPS